MGTPDLASIYTNPDGLLKAMNCSFPFWVNETFSNPSIQPCLNHPYPKKQTIGPLLGKWPVIYCANSEGIEMVFFLGGNAPPFFRIRASWFASILRLFQAPTLPLAWGIDRHLSISPHHPAENRSPIHVPIQSNNRLIMPRCNVDTTSSGIHGHIRWYHLTGSVNKWMTGYLPR